MGLGRTGAAVGVCALLLSACRGQEGDRPKATHASATPGASTSPVSKPSEETFAAIDQAERERRADWIAEPALTAEDVEVRRAATQALARISDPAARPLLRARLADQDPEVVRWAAYGLGFACFGSERETVAALVMRATPRVVATDEEPEAATEWSDALDALADALGRCGTPLAERTLRAWLHQGHASAERAAFGLGRIATRAGRLEDATLVALLDAAAQKADPVAAALYPMGRLDGVPPSMHSRLADVASGAIARGGQARSHAITALSSAGPQGVDLLARVLVNAELSTVDRAAAARALGRARNERAQAALAEALESMISRVSDDALGAPDAWTPLWSALSELEPPAKQATDALVRLAELPVPPVKQAAKRTRLIELRCLAASVLAGTASLSKRLVACDPDPAGRAGATAILRVLDRGELTRQRARRWHDLARSEDPMIVRRALELAARHPELDGLAPLLARSLTHEAPGVVATAATLIAKAPTVASTASVDEEERTEAAPAPDPAVRKALAAALDRERPADQIETVGALLRAAASLQLLRFKPRIEALCQSEHATLRRHASLALRRLVGDAKRCGAVEKKEKKRPTPSAPAAPGAPVTLTFVTDVGRLGMTLDPAHAPHAVGRVVDLARTGFYDGMTVHRAVPGFVVQLGDRVGDGYGGASKPPLKCETSPIRFSPFKVGMALSGRDTGSSQVFVTLSEQPHLDGNYPLIGSADPEWAHVAEGDRIDKVLVKDGSKP